MHMSSSCRMHGTREKIEKKLAEYFPYNLIPMLYPLNYYIFRLTWIATNSIMTLFKQKSHFYWLEKSIRGLNHSRTAKWEMRMRAQNGRAVPRYERVRMQAGLWMPTNVFSAIARRPRWCGPVWRTRSAGVRLVSEVLHICKDDDNSLNRNVTSRRWYRSPQNRCQFFRLFRPCVFWRNPAYDHRWPCIGEHKTCSSTTMTVEAKPSRS